MLNDKCSQINKYCDKLSLVIFSLASSKHLSCLKYHTIQDIHVVLLFNRNLQNFG